MPSRRSAMASSITPPSEVSRPPSKSAVIFRPRTAGNANGGIVSWVMAGVASRLVRMIGLDTQTIRNTKDLGYARLPLVHRSMNKTG